MAKQAHRSQQHQCCAGAGKSAHVTVYLSSSCILLQSVFGDASKLVNNAMLKTKYASKDTFNLCKEIFTVVLDCVLSALYVNYQKNTI